MPIPLVNSIASWFLKKRFHQMELFLKYPNEVQQELLHVLLETAKNTEVGRAYDFATISNYETFRERVPVLSYEDFEPMIERSRLGEHNIFWPTPIKWFAKSSGILLVQKVNLYLLVRNLSKIVILPLARISYVCI